MGSFPILTLVESGDSFLGGWTGRTLSMPWIKECQFSWQSSKIKTKNSKTKLLNVTILRYLHFIVEFLMVWIRKPWYLEQILLICESPDVRWPFLLFKKHGLEMTIDKNFSANNTGHTSQSSSVGSAAADCRDKNTNELHLNLRCWLHFPFDGPTKAQKEFRRLSLLVGGAASINNNQYCKDHIAPLHSGTVGNTISAWEQVIYDYRPYWLTDSFDHSFIHIDYRVSHRFLHGSVHP